MRAARVSGTGGQSKAVIDSYGTVGQTPILRGRRNNDLLAASVGNSNRKQKEIPMLYTIAVILIILWLLGLVSAYTMGGFIHILLVVAIVMILVRLISGRSAL